MLYQIRYTTATGTEGTQGVNATDADEAIRLFLERWTEYGDALPASYEIAEAWSISY